LDRAVGVVLIDEVDLHLHPGWQQQILPSLRSTFPGVQFVVTTHSPQVLSTVAAEHVRVLTDEAPGVSGVSYSAGLRTDKVLQSILGTDPAPRTRERLLVEQYMALVHDGQAGSSEARNLRKTLEDKVGDHVVLPELAEADAEIAVGDLT
jgi:predicted ATP-binding protein involved in virulence